MTNLFTIYYIQKESGTRCEMRPAFIILFQTGLGIFQELDPGYHLYLFV